MLLMGPVNGVMLAVNFPCPFDIIGPAFVVRTKSSDIKRPDVQARFALDNPLGHHATGTATGGNSESIESDSDEYVLQLRRRPQDRITIRRKGLRAVD